jgi:hypothetical protein
LALFAISRPATAVRSWGQTSRHPHNGMTGEFDPLPTPAQIKKRPEANHDAFSKLIFIRCMS